LIFHSKKSSHFKGGGLILFHNVEEAIRAGKVLKSGNYETKLVAPPPELRIGCDLGLEINVLEMAGVERLLRRTETSFVQILPLK
jgi:hypothetical protein